MRSLIVLAAGKSTRMHGSNKLLARIDNKPMIRKVVEEGLNSKVDEVIVVLGWEAEKVRETLADLPCRFVMNKDYERGQSSSVKAGLRKIGDATQAVLILPGDVALINSRTINLVLEAHDLHGNPIVVASHRDKLGHPILLAKQLFREIEAINEQTYGLKSVIKRHKSEMRLVETGSDNVLKDVDTPDDLKRLQG